MSRPPIGQLTPVQQAILACTRDNPGRFSRSELAKLLVGSRSSRAGALADHPDFGRLAGYGRKAVTVDIDILLQQGYLVLDHGGRMVHAGDSL